MNKKGFEVVELPITYYKNTSLEKALDRLFVETDRAYRDGANIIILSDRVDENHVAIPSLLAVSAMHQYLIKTKRRTSVALILEAGNQEVHHFATLLGYGACAVNPYLALQGIKKLIDENNFRKIITQLLKIIQVQSFMESLRSHLRWVFQHLVLSGITDL